MTVPFYFAVMYTKGGIATAPSDTPTISVIDKDNNLLVNAQPATKLSNLAGHCVYAYDGAVGLACWGQFHSTDTTLDQQDLGSVGIPYQISSIKESVDAIFLDTGTNGVIVSSFINDSITSAALKADAVTKIQSGLATPTNITAGTITTATNLTNLPTMPADWITALGVKADAVTKIQAGMALETTLNAIKGAGWTTETLVAIDVLLDAIKAKTDSLFTEIISSPVNLPYISASPITLYTNSTNSVTVAGIPNDEEIWFTIKTQKNQPDSSSIIQISKTEGLLYANGVSGSSIDASLSFSDGNLIADIGVNASPMLLGNSSINAFGEVKTRTSGSVVSIKTQFPVVIASAITKSI